MKINPTVFLFTFYLFASQQLLGQGFPNVPQTPGALLSEGSNVTLLNPDSITRNPDVATNESGLLERQQGRTAIIAWFNGWLYSIVENSSSAAGSDLRNRVWDLSDLDNLTAEYISLPDGSGPMNSHGWVQRGDLIDLGNQRRFRFQSPGVNALDNAAPFPPSFARDFAYWPYTMTMYWSYNDTTSPAQFGYNGATIAQWDHLGLTGVIGHPMIIGDRLLMAADQTRSGIAAYNLGSWMDPDVLDGSEPASPPQLLDVLTTGGPGGYWPELYGADGQLFMVFPYRTNGNGIRVVDVTGVIDPDGSGQMEFVADIPLGGAAAMYVQFQDHYAFTGSHKIDMRTLKSDRQFDLNGAAPGFGDGIGDSLIDTSQFALPIGNLLVTGGSGPNQGMSIWAHAADPDTAPPTVGYHVPQAGRTNYPLRGPVSILIHETLESWSIVHGDTFDVVALDGPNAGLTVPGEIQWTFNDMLQFTPDQPWESDRSYEVRIQNSASGDPIRPGILDAAGNVMEPYSFTFSTGPAVGGNQAPAVDSFTVSDYPAPSSQLITFDVVGSDPDVADTLEYRFDFGDGTPRTAWGAVTQATHSYLEVGHHKALVQVRDNAGLIATQTLVVTVTDFTPTPAQPSNSGPIACDETARRLWAVNPDNNTVTAMNADTLATEFETQVGGDPRAVAIDASGNAWVTCHDADQIDIVNSVGVVVDTIALDYGDAPFGIVLSPDGQFAWVSLMGSGEIARISTATQAITRLPLGPTPRALSLSADGEELYVSRFLSPANHAEIWEVDTAALAINRTLRIAKFAGGPNRDSTAAGFGVANYLTGLALSPDGQQLLVASNKMNTDRGTLSGQDLDQDNTVRNIVTLIGLGTAAVNAIDIDNSDSAHAVAWSPLGDYFFVTLQGNNEIAIFDTLEIGAQAGTGGLLARRSVGLAPQGIYLDTTENQLFVKNFMDRTVSVLDVDSFFQTGSISLGAQPPVSTVQTEQLAAEILLGKQVFYNASDLRMSAEGYISCATCHLDGGHDGRVWDFTGRGEGLRNTASLRGRSGTGHGAVHWSGNFDEIQDFEHDIRGAFGGTGFMGLTRAEFASAHPTPISGPPKAGQSADLDALAAYVASLDVFTNATGTTIQAETGVTAGTVSVHTNPGDLFNNYDDIPRAGGFVHLEPNGAGASVAFNNVDGGTGGVGALEVRFTNNHGLNDSRQMMIRVTNSAGTVEYPVDFPSAENGPSWFYTAWISHRIEGLDLEAGPNNSIEIATADGDTQTRVGIDEVVVSSADDLLSAQVHRQALSITQTDRDNLIAYLQQLDGAPLTDLGPPPAPGFNVELPAGGEVVLESVVSFGVEFNLPVTGFAEGDLIIGGSSGADSAGIVELTPGMRYRVEVTGMANTGTVTLRIAANAAQSASGQNTPAGVEHSIIWRNDDLWVLSDEFDDSSTLTNWQRLNVVEGWNAEKLEVVDVDTSAPDHLRLVPTPSTFYQSNVGPLLFKNITGDFVVTMELEVRRRDGSLARPISRHSLGGILMRAPRTIAAAEPNPAQPPNPRLAYPSGAYATDWTPGDENFMGFTFGMGGLDVEASTPVDQWHFGVGNTIDSASDGYQDFRGLPVGVNVATLQVVRRGATFLFLRKHADGEWIIEDRQMRPDLPETLQIGAIAVTSYWGLLGNQAAAAFDIDGAYHHNRNVFIEANGFAGLDADLRGDIDYVRFKLPPNGLTETMLQSVESTSDSANVQLLGDSILAAHLGDPVNQPYAPPAPDFEAFVGTFGLSGVSGADTDGDGASDFDEWAQGATDPIDANDFPLLIPEVRMIEGSDCLTMNYVRISGGVEFGENYNVPGVSFTIEGSVGLINWDQTPVHVSAAAGLPAVPEGYEWGCVRLPQSVESQSGGFFRLNASASAP
ncbi:MAG: DNA-binding beta-propeller fold protein YncE [Verrucomicrobiales bacterium]|jgi:DNA-binding beta-propeller fold protein YncE